MNKQNRNRLNRHREETDGCQREGVRGLPENGEGTEKYKLVVTK